MITDIKKIAVHLVKEQLLLRKYYNGCKSYESAYVSLIDDRRNSFGLTDRLKGIVSLYAFSKVKNVRYKCCFTYPFDLSYFLSPNQYNWIATSDEISDNPNCTKILILQGENGKRLLMYNSKKQLHAYINRNYIPIINQVFHKNFEWGKLFLELFKPTFALQSELNHHLSIIGTEYIGCVFRFQSLLGDFKEYNFPTLSIDMQDQLINKCIKQLIEIQNQYGKKILLTSDSSKFIQAASLINNLYTMKGKVVHLDCTTNEDTSVYMKSFVDFFMLSKAERIFSIGTADMYPTEFPFYAAKINDIPFERILI